MIRVVCSVRDNAIEAFGQPFFVPHIGAATRSFVDECRGDSPVKAHPSDFDLYQLGWFDESSGLFTTMQDGKPLLVLRGVSAVEV